MNKYILILFSISMLANSYCVESKPAKKTLGCIGKTVNCNQMTYKFADSKREVFVYIDHNNKVQIYGKDAHSLTNKELSSILKRVDQSQNNELTPRRKSHDKI